DRIVPTIWKARIRRCHNAERCEVSRRDREVVGGGEVLQPPLEVSDLYGDARQHLLLNRYAELPVSWTHAPPSQQAGIGGWRRACGCSDCRRSRGSTFALGGVVGEIALRNEVAGRSPETRDSSICPVSIRGRRSRADRVSNAIVAIQVYRRIHVLPDLDL